MALVVGALALPAAAQPLEDAPRILGFSRQLGPGTVELILACSDPVAFHYSSPTLETIRLVLPGVDPRGVTPPREAWGGDLASVELSAAEGNDAPGAILLLELDAFRPYSITSTDTELRVALDVPGVPPAPPPPPAVVAVEEPAAEPAAPDPAPPPAPETIDPPAAGADSGPGGDPAPASLHAEPSAASAPPELPDPRASTATVVGPSPGPAEPPAEPPAETIQAPEPLTPEAPELPAPEAPEAPTPEAAPVPVAPDFFEEPAPAPLPLDPALADAAPATRVFEVTRDDRDGVLAIRIPTDGRPSYQAFFTQDDPERLVLDFEGTESRPLFQTLEVGVGPVRRVRVGQHEAEPVPIVRIVFDLDERVSHRIETDATGLRVRFDGIDVEP